MNRFYIGLYDAEENRLSYGCPGDSGAPILRMTTTNEVKIIGVNSAITNKADTLTVNEHGEVIDYSLDINSYKLYATQLSTSQIKEWIIKVLEKE
ncbi:MAG: hypothetical protein HON90_02725 [Halobacteriovoraceae bacterium]|nr:hypothetical protein [Halobacteriovoraceae bacterium]